MRGNFVVWSAVVLGLVQMLNGLFCYLRRMPGITRCRRCRHGPFNPHFVRDIGCAMRRGWHAAVAGAGCEACRPRWPAAASDPARNDPLSGTWWPGAESRPLRHRHRAGDHSRGLVAVAGVAASEAFLKEARA